MSSRFNPMPAPKEGHTEISSELHPNENTHFTHNRNLADHGEYDSISCLKLRSTLAIYPNSIPNSVFCCKSSKFVLPKRSLELAGNYDRLGATENLWSRWIPFPNTCADTHTNKLYSWVILPRFRMLLGLLALKCRVVAERIYRRCFPEEIQRRQLWRPFACVPHVRACLFLRSLEIKRPRRPLTSEKETLLIVYW